MMKMALLALVLSTTTGCFNGCNKKKAQEQIEPSPMPVGSAGSATTEAPKALTQDELAKRFSQCWDAFNQAAWDKFKDCYAPDATLDTPGSGEPAAVGAQVIVDGTKEMKTGFPDLKSSIQLELVHGHDIVGVTLLAGTHTGPLASVTAMNQKIGFLMAQLIALDDQGRTKHEAAYFDEATMMGQLTAMKDHPVRPPQDKLAMPEEVVIAKDDAAEKANVAVAQALIDAFNKHDTKAMGALLADDSVWSEQEEPKDWTKAEAIADAAGGWKAFSDMKMAPTSIWGAGNYVVTVATIEATNDAAMPEMGIKQATKKHVSLPYLTIQKFDAGKVKASWVFAQGTSIAVQLGLMPPGMAGSGSAAGSATK